MHHADDYHVTSHMDVTSSSDSYIGIDVENRQRIVIKACVCATAAGVRGFMLLTLYYAKLHVKRSD